MNELLQRIKYPAQEYTAVRTAVITRENLLTEKSQDRGNIHGVTAAIMKEASSITARAEAENMPARTVQAM